MDENSPHQKDRPESGSPSGPDRILDRKIERRALPASFSSNLARKGPSSGGKASDRSVRSIVTLFEKSAGASDRPAPNRPRLVSGTSDRVGGGDEKENRRNSHGSNNRDINTTKSPQNSQLQEDKLALSRSTTPSMFPAAQVGYQVEDYSLTLLRHKSYFNNRPLARCLDDNSEKDTKTKVQRVKSKKESARELAVEGKENESDEHGHGNKCNKDLPPRQRDTSSPIQQLDDLMSDLLTWQGVSEPRILELERRESPEVNGFWSNLRTQLWVDEEEIYGERPTPMGHPDSTTVREEGNESHTLAPSTSATSLPVSYLSDPEIERPFPPPPTRPPPPIPAAARGRSSSAASSQGTQHSAAPSLELFPDPARDYPAWDEPPPTSSVRLSMTAPGELDIADLLSEAYPEPELPPLPEPGRPLPVPPTASSHSRHPSSSGSGPWTRPPTWRSPSSLGSSSPPPVPPLPAPIPEPPANHHHRRGRSNHIRNRHQPHSSKTSASTSVSASVSTHSAAVTDSSGGRSVHSRRTPGTSTSSTATHSTRADSGSGTDLSAYQPPNPPLRRLTTEEKLSEIDAFLSPERDDKEQWI
ncbi:hypothetical protein C8A01DRAFT_49990 [Parachaetomium inaequale]|uniref:Uncharacterized protein n=1 Tax=Parachaetomium inaequale TaxID=2588326 RepID=A0AAN6P9S5_9PEZI|nr:hypothetical protein C8A01DRAFT_49990 [Parachaetomium inaequale]